MIMIKSLVIMHLKIQIKMFKMVKIKIRMGG
jgi:hypothetical protein